MAIQTASNDSRHVRLGTYFLRNAFVQLDFDRNIIVMGTKNAVKDILIDDDVDQQKPSDDGKDKPSEPTKPADDNKPTDEQPHDDGKDQHDDDSKDKPSDD